MKQAGGTITAWSLPAQGTLMSVYFPRVAEERKGPEPVPVADGRRGGTETILLVEDELSLRRFIRDLLEGRGFTVLESADGAAALATIEKHGMKLDMLVTDLIMPGMGGRELAERARELIPGLKVLFISGHTEDTIVRHGIESSTLAFVHKPFDSLSLLAKVREVLDGSS